MYYISGDNTALYVSHSLKAANALAAALGDAKVEEFDRETFAIDFGGCTVGAMRWKEITPYSFLAHHLTTLTNVLNLAVKEAEENNLDYVTFHAYPMSHCMELTFAESMLHTISEKWDEFCAAERFNLAKWEEAIQALSAVPGVDVRKELGVLQPKGMVQ